MHYLHKSKKGQVFRMMNMIPRLIFLVLILTSSTFALLQLVKPLPKAMPLEADLFSWNLMTSPTGLSYYNPKTNNLEPFTINLGNFKNKTIEKRINETFYYENQNKHIAARITLLDSTGLNSFGTIYYNNNPGKAYGYSFWEPVAMSHGKNTPLHFIRSMPVKIYSEKEDKKYGGNIIIEVLISQK